MVPTINAKMQKVSNLPSRCSSARAIPGSQAPTTPTPLKMSESGCCCYYQASSAAAAQVAAVLTDGCWSQREELLLRPKPPSSSCCLPGACAFVAPPHPPQQRTWSCCIRFLCSPQSENDFPQHTTSVAVWVGRYHHLPTHHWLCCGTYDTNIWYVHLPNKLGCFGKSRHCFVEVFGNPHNPRSNRLSWPNQNFSLMVLKLL